MVELGVDESGDAADVGGGRVLHLVDPLNAAVGACGCRLVADAVAPLVSGNVVGSGGGFAQDVLILGGSGAERRARACGLLTADRLGLAGGRAVLGVPALRRYLKGAGPFDLLQCWSVAGLTLGGLAAPGMARVVYLTNPPGTVGAAKWLRILLGSGDGARRCFAVAMTESVKRSWAEAGGIEAALISVIRPGLDFGLVRADGRAELRRRWGIQSDKTFVVGVLADGSVGEVDARRLSHILVMSGLAGLEVAFVLPSGTRGATEARRILGAVDVDVRFVIDEQMGMPWQALAGCDCGLMLGDDVSGNGAGMSGMLPVMWSAAAGKLVIGEASYGLSEVIEHGHSGMLVRGGDDGAIVRRLLEAAGDAGRTWGLRDAARSEAFSFFGRSRFVGDLGRLWDQILRGREIEVAALDSTGGLRFAGRG